MDVKEWRDNLWFAGKAENGRGNLVWDIRQVMTGDGRMKAHYTLVNRQNGTLTKSILGYLVRQDNSKSVIPDTLFVND